MAHLIENMAYVGTTPWHGLGVDLGDEPVTSAQMIEASGLDWRVRKQPLRTDTGIEVNSHVALVRETDDQVLGIVGEGYGVIQPRKAFEFLDELSTAGEVVYETAGSLDGGRRIWALARADDPIEVIPGDRVNRYLLVWNSFDGSSAWGYAPTSVRVVCNNTLTLARQDAQGQGIRVRHTRHAQARVEDALEMLTETRAAHDQFAELAKVLATVQVNTSAWDDYLRHVIPHDADNDPERMVPTRTKNIRARITELFEGAALGSDMARVRGTAWQALNAVTQYSNFERSARGRGQEGRFKSVLWGSSSRMHDRALRYLIDVAANRPAQHVHVALAG